MRKLTLDQAANELGIKRASVYKRAQRNTLPYTIESDGRMYVYLDGEKSAEGATEEDASTKTDNSNKTVWDRLQLLKTDARNKTVWDWLQLLSSFFIPVILLASAFWLAAQQDARQQQLEDQRAYQARKLAQQAQKVEEQGAKPTQKSEEPIPIKSTTCLLPAANISEPKFSTAEASVLRVTLSVPSNAQECHDTVTIDAPTFGLGKDATQSVSLVRPQKSYVVRWLLDPEKPGSWSIAVETKQDRLVIPVLITTPLGLPARWVDGATLLVGVGSLLFGAIASLRRRE